MEACVFCGSPDNLIEAIGEKEIILVCQSCANDRGIPLIRRPSVDQIKNTYRTPKLNANDEFVIKKKDPETLKLEKELKDMVKKSVSKDYGNLVDNFHWHVQQGRRHKKLSVKQLSEAIAEPEVLIEMIENGQLPENYSKVITKLEQFFRIKLRKIDDKKEGDVLDIKKLDTNEVTVGDLKEINEKKKGIFAGLFGRKNKEDNISEEKTEKENLKEDIVEGIK